MDKLGSGFCIKCGTVLLDLKAPLQMCSQCQKWTEQRVAEKLKNRKGAFAGKKIKMKIGLLAKAQNA